jgi:hypothetical protein
MMSIVNIPQPLSKLGKPSAIRCVIQISTPQNVTHSKILISFQDAMQRMLADLEQFDVYALQLAVTVDEVKF